MKKKALVFGFLLFAGLFTVVNYSSAAAGDALWARSTLVSPHDSTFFSSVTDSLGNIYAVGRISEAGQYDFGNGVVVSGGWNGSEDPNPVIVKYNSAGVAQWARSTVIGPSRASYKDIAIDSQSNVYAVGYISGTGQFNFGSGITVSGTYAGYNVVIVKYSSNGTTQWAKSLTSGSLGSEFESVAVDSSGGVYAVGYISDSSQYNFGNSVTISGAHSGGEASNPVVVKYNSSGVAQWARSTSASPDDSGLSGVAVDASGNVYASGSILGDGQYDFGNNVTVAGASQLVPNTLVLKYNSSGTAQWARSTIATPSFADSGFRSLAVDPSGNVYAVGRLSSGVGTFSFGNGADIVIDPSSWYGLLVKYDSSGVAQWARSTALSGTCETSFYDIVSDSSNNAYVVGYLNNGNSQTISFGNGVSVTGSSSYNPFLVKYNSSGTARWAKSTYSGLNSANYYGIALSMSGANQNLYVAGEISTGEGLLDFGNGVSISKANPYFNAVVIVKYLDDSVVSDTTPPAQPTGLAVS